MKSIVSKMAILMIFIIGYFGYCNYFVRLVLELRCLLLEVFQPLLQLAQGLC